MHWRQVVAIAGVACSIVSNGFAEAKRVCVYSLSNGAVKQVNSWSLVPDEAKPYAKCFEEGQNSYLAAPDSVSLKGSVREAEIVSPLGAISLRWQRSVETLFGRTPERAMSDAAQSVNRALKTSGFPPELQRLALEWHVVFMDESVPTTQIPSYLVSNCHPAWMTPPANVYVVAQRVAAGCGGQAARPSNVNDGELSQVLIHEIGHAIEYALLKGNGQNDRMRAEGFACWFEQFASDYSTVNSRGKARSYYQMLARRSFTQSPHQFVFRGSADDYARASMYFAVVVQKRGIKGLMDVYHILSKEGGGFFDAAARVTGLNEAALAAEAAKMAAKW